MTTRFYAGGLLPPTGPVPSGWATSNAHPRGPVSLSCPQAAAGGAFALPARTRTGSCGKGCPPRPELPCGTTAPPGHGPGEAFRLHDRGRPAQRVPADAQRRARPVIPRHGSSLFGLISENFCPQVSGTIKGPGGSRRQGFSVDLAGRFPYPSLTVPMTACPGKPGHEKAPWTIRQDHPGGKDPATGPQHAS